ncbi:dimethylarginine dimethylaminohydrolase family protein [Jannaschia seohaensis]|uniref:arginine deiminase n=1 Tax=Jannaschia seohaensis TaxID=475081 RepID=A0A2Y9A1S9_9RHOB|nr:arginine deiminase family protein [Jannaschia seohaensis]PWJ22223.1 N-dimethylarginine dimethylaminohydrolase [Jannaschia seohaensis]SSA38501.1 N-Dimethylarginine dimethylaminohydrolase [Jannaschia seohaensis]
MTASDGFGTAAYGGAGWSPRTAEHGAEMGPIWQGGIDSEWRPLRQVLLRRPGAELAAEDVDAAQYLEPLDLGRAQAEHDALAAAYVEAGVEVLSVGDVPAPTPNRMFCADTFVMTPQGAILARPASTVRAGEEVAVAAALAAARVPILRTLTGGATFEGADLIWVDARTCLIGLGLRTNAEAARQIAQTLAEIGIEAIPVDMPFGTMHLMGMLRMLDADLAIAWPRRTPHRAVTLLRERGHTVAFLPDADEVQANRGLNVVALGPRRVLMPAGNDAMRAFYEGLGVEVVETPCFELRKAAGAVGCLTGVVARDMG